MATINIQSPHHLGRQEAQRRVHSIEPDLSHKYGVKLAWTGDKAEVHGKGVSGLVVVDDTRVAIDLDLGLLLRPFKGKVQSEVKQRLDRALLS